MCMFLSETLSYSIERGRRGDGVVALTCARAFSHFAENFLLKI